METRTILTRLCILPLLLLNACDNIWLARKIGDSALGAVAVGLYEFATNKPCRDGVRRVYFQEKDSWGETHPVSRNVYVDCDQPGVYGSRADAARVAAAYQLKERTGYLLFKLLKESQAGNVQALFSAGLSQDDLNNLAVYDMPTREGLQALGKKWSIDEKTVTRVFKKILKDARKLDEKQAFAERR